MSDSSETLHEPPDALGAETRDMHRALVSLQEELEAVDWYRQRSEVCSDDELRAILDHNMREEIEHAAMVIEWLRRRDDGFAGHLKDYLFTQASITEVEAAATEGSDEEALLSLSSDAADTGFTIGSLKEKS